MIALTESLRQLRQFLPRRKAEAVMAAFSVSMIAESEHARSEVFDNPESVYRACADMKLFNQEVLRGVLLDTRQRLISVVQKARSTKLWLIHERFSAPRSPIQPILLFWCTTTPLATLTRAKLISA
jgi:hypothetical protein